MLTPDELQGIRNQFPALSIPFSEWIAARADQFPYCYGNDPVVFLDGPGGTQVPTSVMTAMQDAMMRYSANAHGAFITSQLLDQQVDAARQAAADLLGCDRDEIVFGPNMTSLTFAFSRAIGRTLHPGDEIIVTQLDHDANISPWQALREKGVIIRQVTIHPEDCTLDLEDFKSKLNSDTRLVAVGAASNTVGSIPPLAEMIELAHTVGAWVYVDAVHYIPHHLVDVKALDCDFLACSAYKFCGPHLGILYGKRDHLERLQPYKVRPAPDEVPSRWETGTQNFEGIAGLLATIQYFENLGRQRSPESRDRRAALQVAFSAIAAHEQDLCKAMIKGLLQIPGLQFYGIRDRQRLDQRTPTVSVRVEGHSPEELAKALGDRGIFTWHGHFYAISLAEALGVADRGGFLRIGLVHYNTISEVQRMLNAFNEIVAAPRYFFAEGDVTRAKSTTPLP